LRLMDFILLQPLRFSFAPFAVNGFHSFATFAFLFCALCG